MCAISEEKEDDGTDEEEDEAATVALLRIHSQPSDVLTSPFAMSK
jgi:hypothetical protein